MNTLVSVFSRFNKQIYLNVDWSEAIQHNSFKCRSATLFTVHAVSSHVGLMSLAELGVKETVPGSWVRTQSRGGIFVGLVLFYFIFFYFDSTRPFFVTWRVCTGFPRGLFCDCRRWKYSILQNSNFSMQLACAFFLPFSENYSNWPNCTKRFCTVFHSDVCW